MRLVKVLWDDAYSLPDDWHDLPVEPPEPRPMVSVGFVVGESEWGISIAHTFDKQGKSCAGVIVIPKGMVKKVVNIGS